MLGLPEGAPQAATCVVSESCHRPDPALPDSAWDSWQLPAWGLLWLFLGQVLLFAAEGYVPGRCQLLGRPSENLLSLLGLFQTVTVL